MNIVIPMAGISDLNGFHSPKNFYEIDRRPLFQHVFENLPHADGINFIFIVRREEVERYYIDQSLRLLSPNCIIVELEGETSGAACTVLLASKYIDNDQPLVIANGDQIIQANLNKILHFFDKNDADGGIVAFDSVHPRWSYIRIDQDGFVSETAEKRPISRNATAGFYYFKRGADYVLAAQQMIKKDAHIEGKYYVCPVYNEMILAQKRIMPYSIEPTQYFSLTSEKGIAQYERALRSEFDWNDQK